MDRFDFGDPEYYCHWCQTANWEPDDRCEFCGRFQPGSRFHEMYKGESNVRRHLQAHAEQ